MLKTAPTHDSRPFFLGNPNVPGRFFWLLAALILALLILRRPDSVTNPQFWAEDGNLYFQGQILYGLKKSIMSPYNGYLSVLSRIIAWLASFLPVYPAPLIYTLAGSAIDAICCSIFFLPMFRHIVRSDWIRMAVCILSAATPKAEELIGNVVNIQWYLLLPALLLLFRPVPRANSIWTVKLLKAAAWGLLGLLFTLTNPVLILAVPFCVWNIVKSWRTDRIYELAILVGLTIQMYIFVAAKQAPSDLLGHLNVLAAAVVFGFVYRCVVGLVLGYNFTFWAAMSHSLIVPVGAMIATAVLIGCVLWKGDRKARWKVAILLYVAAASLAVTLGGRNFYAPFASLREFTGLGWERYLLLAGSVFICLIAVSIETLFRKIPASDALLLLVLIFGIGTVRNYRIPAFDDMNWANSARLIQDKLDHHRIGVPPQVRAPIRPSGWFIILD
jgi:hypothetical protein